MSKAFVNTDNTGSRPTSEYSKVINDIAKQGVCPFCPDQLAKFHKKPIEEKTYWVVTDNMYPYKPTQQHRLIIHKTHVTHIAEISEPAWHELRAIISDETKKRDLVGGTFIARFGDTKFTGASVSHLHAHIVQSDPEDASYDKSKGLTMRIG